MKTNYPNAIEMPADTETTARYLAKLNIHTALDYIIHQMRFGERAKLAASFGVSDLMGGYPEKLIKRIREWGASLEPTTSPASSVPAKEKFYRGDTRIHGYPCHNCHHLPEDHAEGYICPSPAESVPLDGPEAVRVPASGLDSSSADVPPVEDMSCPSCGVVLAEFQDSCDACGSPAHVDSKDGLSVFLSQVSDIGDANLRCMRLEHAIPLLTEIRDKARKLRASHAAHLAKIQALTEALRDMLSCADVGDMDSMSNACESARAALSLPSAPLGS